MVQKKTVTRSQEYAENIISTMREPSIALDQNLRVVYANRSFYEIFKVKPEETVGQLIYDLGNKQWDIPKLRELLEDILPKKTTFDDYEVEHVFDAIGRRIMLLNARQIERGIGKERIILLAIEDITECKRLQEESEAYEEHYRSAFEASHDGLLLIHRSKGDILDSNPLAQELLGYSKEEFLKKNLWGIGVVKDDKDFQEALSRLERDGVIYYDNISVKNKAGLIVNTEVILVDKVKFIQCNIRDITERRLVEEALKKSEEKYRSIFENVQDVYYETLFDGTILEVSPSIESISKGQYKRADLIGKSMYEFYADIKDRDNLMKAIQKTGSVSDFEVPLKNRDGSLVPCSISAKMSFDAKGQPNKIVGSMHDIAERKQTEETVNLLNHTIKSINECISITDSNNKILFVNQAFLKTYGYTEEEAIGKSISIVRAEKIKTKDTILNATLQGGWHGELMNRRKDGTVFPVFLSTSVVYNGKNQPIALVGVAVDITERIRAEEELKKSEEKFRRVVETALEGVWFLDREFKTTEVTDAIVHMLGYSPEELIGKPFIDMLLDEDRFIQAQEFQRRRIGVSGQYERRFKCKDGSLKWLFLSAKAIINTAGEFLGTFAMVTDITERKRTEQELRESKALIEAVVENVPLMIFIKEATDLRFVIFNRAGEELLGYDRKALLGKNNLDLFPPEQAAHFMAKDREVLDGETGMLDIPEEPIMTAKKGQRLLHTRKICIKGADGVTKYLLGISEDITESKRAEEELKKSEEKYRSIFENVQDVYFETSMSNTILEISPSIEIITNGQYRRSDLIGKSMNEFHPNAKEQNDLLTALQERGSVTDFEITLKNRDGSMIPCSIISKIQFDAQGNPEKIIGSLRDITKRKRVEEELKNSEEKYRNLIDNMNEGVFISNQKGLISFANKALANIHGYDSPAKLLNTYFTDYIEPSMRDELLPNILNGKQSGKMPRLQVLPIIKPDGSKAYVQIQPNPIYKGMQIVGTIGIVQDITESKRTEEEIKFRNIILNTQQEVSIDGIVVIDKTGQILSYNQPFVKMWGISPEVIETRTDDLVLKSVMDKLEEPQRFIEKVKYLYDHQNETSREEIALKDGRILDRYSAPMLGADAKYYGRVWYFRDITVQKRAEEALQESELRFRSLYENTTVGLYRTTPDGKIILANPALVKMLGHTSFQQLAEIILEKGGFESSSQRKEFLEKIERDGVVYGHDSKWIRQDGKAIFILESARAIRDSQGKTLYYDGTVEDITERRQMEEGLRQMQKLEGLGTLAGGIAHDFNNILGIILAYITSTLRYKDDTKKLDLAVNTIVKAVERGKTLVQQILTFARKTDTEFGPVKVNDVVMEIMVMIFETFPKTLTYAQNFDKGVSYINADRSQLHQLLLNLCVNARDAMPKGGVLTINTRMVSVDSLRYQHPDAVASSYVCIEVCDTGEGMTPGTREKIFEPFFTTKEQGKGTGLGLAVVFGVVQTHKGFVDVESELGKGTTFSIYLPASQIEEPISVKDGETLEEIQGGTETLLIVEDEEMLMMSLRMALVDKGYKVLNAGDGVEAVNIYKERMKEIGLVLTDLGLPKMSGMEECAQIKKLNPDARMIVATGYLDPGMKSEFLKAGIHHFLYKPYDLKQVLKVIREALDEK